MADENEQQPEQGQAGDEPASPEAAARSGSLLWVILSVAVVVVAAGAGFALSRLMNQPREAAASQQEADVEPERPRTDLSLDYMYYELDPITVNLNEPRLARYMRAKITMAMRPGDHDAVKELIKKKNPELVSWLNAYLAGCSLEEVRGTSNQNRMMREIKDAFNERLWPDGRPRIVQILFTEFTVQ